MSKVNYIKCDICGHIIKNGIKIKRILNRKTNIDFCEECFNKIKFLSNDIEIENKVIDEIIGKNPYKESQESSIYLQGVQDALKILSHYRLNNINMF